MVVANSEGQKPNNTVQQTPRFVVAVQWDKKTIYWTVELEDHRIIVKGSPCGWRAWLGIGLGLATESVAFPAARTAPNRKIDQLHVDFSDLGTANVEKAIESQPKEGLTNDLANSHQAGVYYDSLYRSLAKHLTGWVKIHYIVSQHRRR